MSLSYDKTRAGAAFNFPNFLITDVTVDVEVRGVVKYTVNGRQSGDYLDGETVQAISTPSTQIWTWPAI